MVGRLHLGIDPVNSSILIDEICDPASSLILATHELFGSPHAVGGQHFMALIAQHGVIEALFLHELALFYGWVSADAYNLDALLFEFLEFITESLTLDGSARGAGFGEKPQDNFPAPEVFQGNQILVGIRQGEIGCL